MARQALEPGEVGIPWFEYYSKPVKVTRPDGSETTTRTRLPSGTKANTSAVDQVIARVRYRLPDGSYRQLKRTGRTKGAAQRALEKALAARRPTPIGVTEVRPTWTVEMLANYWLEHRKRTGLARRQGDLRPSSYRQIAVTVRVMVLGDRRTRVDGKWVVAQRAGGIPDLKIAECTTARIQAWLGDLEDRGLSTAQTRSVLNQMFHLAVRDGALPGNPMASVEPSRRTPKTSRRLNIERARQLRELVKPATTPRPTGGRPENTDLADIIDFCLGTGCRIGEVLAVRWSDVHLSAEIPYVVICGTMIEARAGLPYERYPARKNDDRDRDMGSLAEARAAGDAPDLTLFLPSHLVSLLRRRRKQALAERGFAATEPVFANADGGYLWANNIRQRLRTATANTDLAGVKPHAIRKLVSTVIERELGMESARHQMGHTDTSLTGQVYVEDSMMGPDARDVLQVFFDPPGTPTPHAIRPRPSSIRPRR